MIEQGILVRRGRDLLTLAGSATDWQHHLWRALLLAGEGAVASHRSAGSLWQLDGIPPEAVDVSVNNTRRPRRVQLLHLSDLDAVDVVECAGYPLTSVGRTLADVGRFVDDDIVERAAECALRRRAVDVDGLWARAASGRPGQRGPAALRRYLLRRPPGAVPTESDAETLFVQLARRCELEDPVRQHSLILDGRPVRLDFAWPHIRLAIEIDGAATHATADALGRDLRRQNKIVLGWLIQRFTWEDVARYPDQVAETLLIAWRYASMQRLGD